MATVTGKIYDQEGVPSTAVDVLIRPANEGHVIKVGGNVELGAHRWSGTSIPDPITLEAGVWTFVVSTTQRVNRELLFPPKSFTVDLTTVTTISWAEIYEGVAAFVPVTPSQVVEAQDAADAAALSATDAEASATSAATSAAAAQAVGDTNDTIVAGVVNDPASATSGALSATIGTRRTPADSMRTWGHSYLRGTGPTGVYANLNDVSTIASETLGLPLRNEAISGAALFAHNSAACNYSNVLQKFDTHPRWARPGGLHVTMWGINDVAELGNTVPELLPYEMAYRVVIARLRAGRVLEQTDATVTLGGATWSTASSTAYNSGPSIAYTATVGATITINTPEDFPGGAVTLGFSAYTADGGTVEGTFGGVTYTLNTNQIAQMGRVQAQGARTASCIRIPGVPAGANAITFTVTAAVGPVGVMFDYWSWEPPEDDCPLVVLVKQPHPVDYTQYVGPEVMPTDAGMDAVNTILDTLAAEFGERVLTVDTSIMDNSEVYFDVGDVHPNVAGHWKLAELIANAVRDKVTAVVAPNREAGRVEYRASVPTVADRNYVKGDIIWNTNPAPSGYIGWVCTVDGAPGTWKGFGAIQV